MLIITSSLCAFPFSIPPSWKLQRRPSQCVGQDISPTQLWPNVQPTNCLIHVRDNCWWKLLMTLLMTVFITNAKCPTNKLLHSYSWQLLMTVFTTFVDDNTYENCQIPNFLTHVDDNCYQSWWSHFIHFVIFFSWKFQVLTLVAQCANRLFLPLPTGGVGGLWGVLHYMARKQLAISKIMTQLFHHLAFVLRSIYARTMRCFDVSLVTFSHYIAGSKGCKGNQVLTSEISIFFLFVFQLMLLFIWSLLFFFISLCSCFPISIWTNWSLFT